MTPTAKNIAIIITEAITFTAKKHGITVAEVLGFCEMKNHPVRKQVESLALLGGAVLAGI